MCQCETDVETTKHFLLHCHCFSIQRSELFDYLYRLDPSFSKLNTTEKVANLLYGSTNNSICEHFYNCYLQCRGKGTLLIIYEFRQNLQRLVEVFFCILMFINMANVLQMYHVEKLQMFFGIFWNDVY